MCLRIKFCNHQRPGRTKLLNRCTLLYCTYMYFILYRYRRHTLYLVIFLLYPCKRAALSLYKLVNGKDFMLHIQFNVSEAVSLYGDGGK
jgi:hypothetical protein